MISVTSEPPTLGELMRVMQSMREEQKERHRELTARVDSLVSSDVFDREIVRLDNSIATMNANLGREVNDRREAIRTVRADCQKETEDSQADTTSKIMDVHTRMDKISANFKWLIAVVVLPVALFIANIVFANPSGAGQ